MPTPNEESPPLSAACSVSKMARLVGLSRAQFYCLIERGVFLAPLYGLQSRRAYYPREFQERNLEARREHRGINGEMYMFNEPRQATPPTECEQGRSQRNQASTGLLQGLRGLGLTNVLAANVDEAITQCFPDGADGVPEGEVLRVVFRYLKRLETAR